MREQAKAPPNGTSSGTFMRECSSELAGTIGNRKAGLAAAAMSPDGTTLT
jgi:hypothetical protein